MNKHYETVGRPLELGQSQLSFDEAMRLHVAIAGTMKVRSVDVLDDMTRIKASLSAQEYMSDMFGDERVAAVTAIAMSFSMHRPDEVPVSHTRLTFGHYRDRHREVKIYTNYQFDTCADQVISATRTVNVSRVVNPQLIIGNGGQVYEAGQRQYKQIERYMDPEDVDIAVARLERLRSRVGIREN